MPLNDTLSSPTDHDFLVPCNACQIKSILLLCDSSIDFQAEVFAILTSASLLNDRNLYGVLPGRYQVACCSALT